MIDSRRAALNSTTDGTEDNAVQGESLLILGNGFDRAIGLPTSYQDFITALETEKNNARAFISQLPIESKELIQKAYACAFYELSVEKVDHYLGGEINLYWSLGIDELLKRIIDRYAELLGLSENETVLSENEKRKILLGVFDHDDAALINIQLVHYFIHGNWWENLLHKENNWSDLEDEIKTYLIDFDQAKDVDEFCERCKMKLPSNIKCKPDALKYLKEDFVAIKRLLYIYLRIHRNVAICVNGKYNEVLRERASFIDSISEPLHVICFNYTELYHTLFLNHSMDNIDYIHGNIDNGNIVLGIDDEALSGVEYDLFKKSFQIREYNFKKKYKIWYQGRKFNNVYIFGASIGESDRYFFKELFSQYITGKFYVYCRDKRDKNKKGENIEKLKLRISENKIRYIIAKAKNDN